LEGCRYAFSALVLLLTLVVFLLNGSQPSLTALVTLYAATVSRLTALGSALPRCIDRFCVGVSKTG